MFFKNASDPTNQFHPELDYKSVLRFIKKNQTLNAVDQFVKMNEENANAANVFLNAINSGDFNDPIFQSEYCHLFALYWLMEKKLSIEEFKTIEIYLAALAQFTDKQQITEAENKKTKNQNIIMSVHQVTEKNISAKFAELINHYSYTGGLINSPKDEPTLMKIDIDKMRVDKLLKQIPEKSELDKLVIILKLPKDLDDLTQAVILDYINNTPFFSPKSEIIETVPDEIMVPSDYLMNEMIKLMNPDSPVVGDPIFGRINEDTLLKMHTQGNHPINLYSNLVKSNQIKVHNGIIGPLLVLLHDYYHLFAGNLASENQYRFAFEYLVPKIMQHANMNAKELMDDYDGKAGVIGKLIDIIAFSGFNTSVDNKENFSHILDLIVKATKKGIKSPTYDPQKIIDELYQDRSHIESLYRFDLKEALANTVVLKNHYRIEPISLKQEQ